MSINDRNQGRDDQEIDLDMLSRKAGGIYRRMNSGLYRALTFAVRRKWILLGLLIAGLALGFYLDRSRHSYEHQLIVGPNFGSVDYLYAKIDLLNSKIKERDTAFLKSIGVTKPKKISKITIEPVVDIYRFIQENEQRLEMVKLMAEDSDIRKIVIEPTTSKYYSRHQITIKSSALRSASDLSAPILNWLNDSDYYRLLQKEIIYNLEIRVKEHDSIIKQINSLLDAYAKSGGKSSSGVYISENSQVNEMIETKERLIRELGETRVEQVNVDNIIKLNSSILNMEKTDIINSNMKIIIPILFIMLFVALSFFLSFLRKHSVAEKQLNDV